MNFNEWRKSDGYDAKKFRMCIAASGDDGMGDYFSEQMKAASHAYTAGIEEGKRRASQIITELITRGMPNIETRFR